MQGKKKPLGQVAYEAYFDAHAITAGMGDWGTLAPDHAAKWEYAAQAVKATTLTEQRTAKQEPPQLRPEDLL